MATFRVGVGSFNIKDGAVGFGTEIAGLGNLRVKGVTKTTGSIVSGASTLTRYSGFAADNINQLENITLTSEVGTIGDIVVGVGTSVIISSASTVTVGTVESVSIGTHISPPTGGIEERGQDFVEGMMRFNTDLNTMEFYNGNEWRQFTYIADIQNSPGSRGRAIRGGGYLVSNGATSLIDLISIPTLGNSVNFGELHTYRTTHGACSSSTRGIFLGGSPDNDSTEYYTLASAGNGIDFGNLTSTGRRYTSSFSSSTRGFSAGGKDDPAVTNEIDYCQISTLSSWLDFGDLTVAALYWSGLSSPTRGLTLVADDPASQVINMVTMASTGNAIDFGNQSKTGGYQSAAANSVRGLWAGGYATTPRTTAGMSKSIEAIMIASQGTSQEFGDLINTPMYGDGSSTSTRAIFAGSGGSNNTTNNIEFVTIATSGNASDFGDLMQPVGYAGVTSDSHGGLGGY